MVEITQYGTDFKSVVDILDGVVGMRGGNACDGTPIFAFLIDNEIFSRLAGDDFWKLPDAFRVVMFFSKPLMGVLRHQMHVLHQFFRLGEHGLVDPLDNDLDPGRDGMQGVDGANGRDGTSWEIGDDGYWYRNGTKTEHKAVRDADIQNLQNQINELKAKLS